MKIITIKSCTDCPSFSNTGYYTEGGTKPCCDHKDTVMSKGHDCFKRVIPYKTNYKYDIPIRISRRIPDWCPLEDK